MLNQDILEQRHEIFTASENHRLMGYWKTKPNEMTKGLETYADEKALAHFFNPDPSLNFNTAHTRNGEEREPECMQMLSEKLGFDFLFTGDDQIHLDNGKTGVTPDGLFYNAFDIIETGAEVKCKSPKVHMKNLTINNTADLQIVAFDNFTQIQTAMLVTETEHWHYANYNPYAKDPELAFKHVVINRDKVFIDVLCKRIDMAHTLKLELIEIYNRTLKRIKKQPKKSKLTINL